MGKPRMSAADISAIFRLTMRQAVFVAAYLGERPTVYNATRSALAAGYSPRHARQSGHQVMASPKVRVVIDRLNGLYMARDYGQPADPTLLTNIDKC